MSKYSNNDTLRNLVNEYELRHRDVVELLTSDYGTVSKKSVEGWLYDYTPMPGPMLELLTLKIRDNLAAQQSG